MKRLKTWVFSFLFGLTPPVLRKYLILRAQNVWIPWKSKDGRYMLWLGDRVKERKWREGFLLK